MRIWVIVLVITLMVADLAVGNGQASTVLDSKPPVATEPTQLAVVNAN